MKNRQNGIEYIGGYQPGDTIRQELKGPIGEGKVLYPGGDRFEGYFHLNYAHIQGPAYAAEGAYTFGDGSFIERAWINTSEDLRVMDLIGLYRVKHPGGPDTLTPFYCHEKDGIEIVLTDEPYAVEWAEGEKIQELEVVDFAMQERSEDIRELTATLGGGIRLTLQSGDTEPNGYGSYVFKTALTGSVSYPGGRSIGFRGYGLRGLRPFDGRFTVHESNGKCHEERWENGALAASEPEKWDRSQARPTELPNPFGDGEMLRALLWDGHISYGSDRWLYDGRMLPEEGLPEGRGILEGDGIRYEGLFEKGLFHGEGRLVNEKAGIVQDGTWARGRFIEDSPLEGGVRLHYRWSHTEWQAYSEDRKEHEEGDIPAEVGPVNLKGFYGLRIDRVQEGSILISCDGKAQILTPGAGIRFSASYEGREWSDGSVMDGDDYSLSIDWPS